MPTATSNVGARSRRPLLTLAAAALACVATLTGTSDAQAADCGPYANQPALAGPPLPGGRPGTNIPGRDRREYRAARVAACLINNQREAAGRPRLKWHVVLTVIASSHTRDLVVNGFQDAAGHKGSDGSTIESRLSRCCTYPKENVTENGDTSPAAAVRWWMDSPPHRATILDRQLQWFGVGMVAKSPRRSPGATYTANFAGACTLCRGPLIVP